MKWFSAVGIFLLVATSWLSNVLAQSEQLSQDKTYSGHESNSLLSKKMSKMSRVTALNPSVFLFHKPHQREGVRAVKRTAEFDCKTVNVVVTLLCKIDENRRVVSFGRLQDGKYKPLDKGSLDDFQQSIQEAFVTAVAEGMDLSILLHLNTWGQIDDWRNNISFDPLVNYGDYNYFEAVIQPTARAIVSTVKPATQVDFSLAGEMGRSVFEYPESYQKILEKLRASEGLSNLHLNVGLSFNFTHVAGEDQPVVEHPGMRALVNACDFIGLSNYRPFELPPRPEQFAETVQLFLSEMKKQGATIPETMPLHFSEVGLGGCTKNGRLTQFPGQAAKTPWEGSDRRRRNPWNYLTMVELRVAYHRALLNFLKQQTTEKQNPVRQAFLWSEGSWDPMDINATGFFDEKIVSMIQEHNLDAVEGHGE